MEKNSGRLHLMGIQYSWSEFFSHWRKNLIFYRNQNIFCYFLLMKRKKMKKSQSNYYILQTFSTREIIIKVTKYVPDVAICYTVNEKYFTSVWYILLLINNFPMIDCYQKTKIDLTWKNRFTLFPKFVNTGIFFI